MKKIRARSNNPIARFMRGVTKKSEQIGEGVYDTLKNIGAGKKRKTHKTVKPKKR